MGINYEMARYTELTGEDGTKVNISRLGGYLDGYDKGRADAIDEIIEKIVNTPTSIKISHWRENDVIVNSGHEIIDLIKNLKE